MILALRWIGVRQEDRRKTSVLLPIFFLCGIAELLTYNGFMTLFNQRFGSEYLPYVYTAEALILPLEAWFMSWLASRLDKPSLMRTLFGIMLGIISVNAAVIIGLQALDLDMRWYYPFLFLSSNFVVRQQTILLWSLAVDLCPTQQAKRLMPYFVGAATLGGAAAGLLAQGVSSLFGASYVYIAAPLFLLAGSFNYRRAIQVYLVPLTLRSSVEVAAGAEEPSGTGSAGYYFRQSLRSPFLLGAIGIMTLMPAAYFLMEYEYLTILRERFPDEADFASYFGMITTLLFTLAFLLQLVYAKLVNWLGSSSMLTAIAAVFTICFALAAAAFGSSVLLAAISMGYLLLYLLLYYVAEPSNQLFFKVLPIAERDGFRYVAQGVSASAGILLGALIQFTHTGFGVPLQLLAVIGGVMAILLLLISLYVRKQYLIELVRSVQAARPQELDTDDTAAELMRSPKAAQAVYAMLDAPEEQPKLVALELIRRTGEKPPLAKLLSLLDGNASAAVRVAALRTIDLGGAELSDVVRVGALLQDPDFEVRAVAVSRLGQATHIAHQAFYFIRLLLLDSNPMVVAEAVKALHALRSEQSYEACYEAVQKLLEEGGETAVYIIQAVTELEMYSFIPAVEPLLDSPSSAVRAAAMACLGKLRHTSAAGRMLALLPEADPHGLSAAIESFTAMGSTVAEELIAVLPHAHPKVWQAAVSALCRLELTDSQAARLGDACIAALHELSGTRPLPAAIEYLSGKERGELARLRQSEADQCRLTAIWAFVAVETDAQVAETLRAALEDPDEETRDNGLEMLTEGMIERRLAHALIDFYGDSGEAGTKQLMSESTARDTAAAYEEDPDKWVRMLVKHALEEKVAGEMDMQQAKLGMLDKVIFLKQVAFFSDLSVDELGLIAGIAEERTVPEGEHLLAIGQSNDTIYVIVDGRVELEGVSAAGIPGTIGVLGPKEVFGETSSLDDTPSNVTASALLGDVRVLAMRGEDVSRLIRIHPEIGVGLLRASLSRVRLLENLIMKIGE